MLDSGKNVCLKILVRMTWNKDPFNKNTDGTES
jgi:hypothetical protein